MYFAYTDEAGTDETSPTVVMVGIIADGSRLTRTQQEIAAIFAQLDSATEGRLRELKSKNLFAGSGIWRSIPGEERRAIVTNLCNWLHVRKHHLALSAINKEELAAQAPPESRFRNIWQAAACHIALQLQRAHQSKPGSKGRTVLVFDDNKFETANFSELIYNPPTWTDDYYNRPASRHPLDQIVDTPFAVRSHHVALVQIADVFAAIFRRYVEIFDFQMPEHYPNEATHFVEWVEILAPRLLSRANRWPRRSNSQCAKWYNSVAPRSLMDLT